MNTPPTRSGVNAITGWDNMPEHEPTASSAGPIAQRRRLLGAAAVLGAALFTGCSTPGTGDRARRPANGATRPPAALNDPSIGGAIVEVLDFEWLDTARDRLVPVRLFMPQQATAAPLVVFSHGLGGSRTGYSHLGRYWASHGVATLHPQHAGSDRAVWSGSGLAMLGSLRAAATPENAIARVNDVRFVIDHLFRRGEWAERLDASRVGVAGHSFGANTALLACGARYREGGGRIATFGDTRIGAAVVMSAPSLPSDQDPAFTYSSIGVPTLHLTGTHDSTPIPGLSTMPEERRIPFDSLAAGPRYLGIFEGGRHSMFNDWTRDATSESIKTETRALTLAFWRSIFFQDQAAAQLLKSPSRARPSLVPLLAAWEAQA